MIDDHWWWGKIDGRRFTNSSAEFLKYRIVWDNGESEFMSPWDMEPIEPSGMYSKITHLYLLNNISMSSFNIEDGSK